METDNATAEAGQEDVFVDGRREPEFVTADSPPPAAVKQTRKMTKSEKYLKLCEVLLIAVVLLAIVGVLLLPTVFYVQKVAAQREVRVCSQ